MQEEIAKKSVNFAFQTTKISARILLKACKLMYAQVKKKNVPVQGKQSVKQLVRQGQGVSSMEVGDTGIRDFKKIANKYGVDFAIVKDKTSSPAKYTVFFKAKDVDAISSVLKEYSAKQVKKTKAKESILRKLKTLKAVVAKTPRKEREKDMEKER